MNLDGEPPWLTPLLEQTLSPTLPASIPDVSVALYVRWWQLERWLRELIYVELSALRGRGWADAVKAALGRQELDAEFTHMSGPDNSNPLAYLDYSQLLEILDVNWAQFSFALVRKGSWDGRQDELRQIRHRIGHMRRPHRDDLGRLEQTLNDLERGAFEACYTYNDGVTPDPSDHADAVTQGWVAGQHDTARRLIEHAERGYDVRLRLSSSRRPWAEEVAALDGAPGYLWHADFHLRNRPIDLEELWRDVARSQMAEWLVHLGTDYPQHLRFTFSAADPAPAIADAIGYAFDLVLTNLSMRDPDPGDWQTGSSQMRV